MFTFDPFEFFPSEISELIFQHLNGDEVLKSMEVSRTWNEIITRSTRIMNKIKLRMFRVDESNFLSSEMLEILINSQRKYQNLEFNQCKLSYIKDVEKILSVKKSQWKCVSLERLNFEDESNFVNFLKNIESSLVELHINNVYFESSNNPPSVNLSKLKVLKLSCDDNLPKLKLILNVENLNELCVASNDMSAKTVEAIVELLKQNKKLKILEMASHLFDDVFESFDVINLQLNSFQLTSHCTKLNYNQPKLLKFVESQLLHLRKFSLDELKCVEILKQLLKAIHLEELHLGCVNSISAALWSTLQLHVNETIKKLSFHDVENKFNILKSIITATPNVRELKIYSLTQNMMEFLPSRANHLEILHARTLDVLDISCVEHFPKLRGVCVEVLTSELEDHMIMIPNEKRSAIVKLILASDYVTLL